MNVDSVMNTYNLGSLWNNLNPNSSSVSTVPLVENVNDTVNEDYTAKNYSGQTASNELQDIYEQVEPDYGISLTYDQNGNLSIPSSTELPTDGLSAEESNVISLLNSGNSAYDSSLMNVLSDYNSIENGTYDEALSSILSNDPDSLYSYMNSLGNGQTQSSGNYIDTAV